MSLTNLVGNRVKREDIYSLATPPGSRTHYTIPHHKLMDRVESELYTQGLEIIEDEHVLDNNGNRYFGMYSLTSIDGLQSTLVGIRNSHDMSVSAGIVCGKSTFCCSNLLFSGEVRLGTRHTKQILSRLPRLIEDAVSKAINITNYNKQRLDDYRTVQITNHQAENIIFDAYRNGVCPASKIAPINEEWLSPSHPEFLVDKQSVFRLEQAFTEQLRPRSANLLHNHINRTQKLVEVLDSVVADQLH
jgi:hypothetical protein